MLSHINPAYILTHCFIKMKYNNTSHLGQVSTSGLFPPVPASSTCSRFRTVAYRPAGPRHFLPVSFPSSGSSLLLVTALPHVHSFFTSYFRVAGYSPGIGLFFFLFALMHFNNHTISIIPFSFFPFLFLSHYILQFLVILNFFSDKPFPLR